MISEGGKKKKRRKKNPPYILHSNIKKPNKMIVSKQLLFEIDL